MKKTLIIAASLLLVCMLSLFVSAEDAITIDAVSFDVAQNTGSITYSVPETLNGKSVTLIVRATNPADTADTGVAYINQYDNITAGTATVDFTVRNTISYGYLSFYVGATDLNTPISATKLYGILGDADKSKNVTSNDAVTILRNLVDLLVLDSSAAVLSDINSDNNITSNDAVDILRYLVDIDTGYPIG